ncbi:hypothetical protein DSL72_009466 [Monilinia vaccinii-corymbosi]|uniref:Mid2 domain-containing protein n=1 Tax=Monilinia vaccinii-corymbosi TaxID=61207 RepID=A0A8A3PPJ9_9HELO|nr:hypothetical protein DSL72_009466 [Monilinia vaccinii-corymbosi]
MHSRSLKLWSMLAIFLAVTHASWIDHGVFNRQNDVSGTLTTGGGNASTGNGSGSDTTASSASSSIDTNPTTSKAPTSAPPSATPTTTADPTTSKPPDTTASNPVSVPESSSAGSGDPTSAPQTSPESTTSPPSSTKGSNPKASKTSTSTHGPARTTFYSLITVTPQPSQIVITIVSTQDGVAYTSQITTSTTASAYATTTPYLTDDTSTDSSKGMSTTTRNTVIGVVVGLGGVILLGGLFVVAWRVWGRPKKEDESGLMSGYDPVSTGIEKSEGAPAPNPFQSTLEGYHQPGRGNVAANF